MRVAIRRMEGIDSVRVSLNDGYADIHFARDNAVTVRQIRTVVRTNGFTPREARVRVAGVVTRRDGEVVLVLPGQGVRFVLHEPPDAGGGVRALLEAGADAEVVLEGRVPEDAARGPGPLPLEVVGVVAGARRPR